MITSIILANDRSTLNTLENQIIEQCPAVKIKGKTTDFKLAVQYIKEREPEMVFMTIEFYSDEKIHSIYLDENSLTEVVLLMDEKDLPILGTEQNLAGYLLKPVKTIELLNLINQVKERIKIKKNRKKDKALLRRMFKYRFQEELIGIPTLEGYEFLEVKKILRCEGLQKCTRIVTMDKTDIVSSYNLGEFTKILEPFGFFLPHRSYLINLSLIKKYHKEGTITMVDNSSVPLARRRKDAFLKNIHKV